MSEKVLFFQSRITISEIWERPHTNKKTAIFKSKHEGMEIFSNKLTKKAVKSPKTKQLNTGIQL